MIYSSLQALLGNIYGDVSRILYGPLQILLKLLFYSFRLSSTEEILVQFVEGDNITLYRLKTKEIFPIMHKN